MKKQKLTIFKGAPTEAKFDNQMTLELAYPWKAHRYIDAKKIMSELVKRWNMHNELIEALKKVINIVNDSNGIEGYYLNGNIAEWDEFEEIAQIEELIKRAK